MSTAGAVCLTLQNTTRQVNYLCLFVLLLILDDDTVHLTVKWVIQSQARVFFFF